MKRLKTSKHFLIAFLVACTAFAAGLLIASQVVMAATNPVKGIGVVVKKNPGGNTANARTNQDGKFTMKLEPGSYTMTLKHADKIAPDTFKTLVVTVEGARGTPIKWFPIAELQKGVTLQIEIAGRGQSTITVTCMATDDER